MDYTLNELNKILTAIEENLVMQDYTLDDANYELDNMIAKIVVFKNYLNEH